VDAEISLTELGSHFALVDVTPIPDEPHLEYFDHTSLSPILEEEETADEPVVPSESPVSTHKEDPPVIVPIEQ